MFGGIATRLAEPGNLLETPARESTRCQGKEKSLAPSPGCAFRKKPSFDSVSSVSALWKQNKSGLFVQNKLSSVNSS